MKVLEDVIMYVAGISSGSSQAAIIDQIRIGGEQAKGKKRLNSTDFVGTRMMNLAASDRLVCPEL